MRCGEIPVMNVVIYSSWNIGLWKEFERVVLEYTVTQAHTILGYSVNQGSWKTNQE